MVALVGAGLGVALGAAVAASAVSSADAIDAAWLYGASTDAKPYYVTASLPGHPDLDAVPNYNDGDVTYFHESNPATGALSDEWYTVHQTGFTLPILGSNLHQEVTAVLDGSDLPHVGTVADTAIVFPIIPAVGGVVAAPLFTNYSLDDPKAGFVDSFTVFSTFGNTFLSDSAGVKDIIGVNGLPPITLFEFPVADAGAGAAEAGSDDGFAQLLAELAGLNPSL
ncbi:hypothetical protein KIH27_07280 [Mycobacterium sp. M1]|uniref:PE-PPE domain-containing protein n=1 Tax=Mycolicibacter acidiphilus TaxID=2835306 RepID=A0ABS5RIJ3_9MYCO|nr:hypothetical protein [Mycolicibacter acidiphilus]MBS9533393.1 hypothetical protein [Mycolicibacter acidiphilus]